MEIRCASCLLRPLVASDAPSLALHANDHEVWLNVRDAFPHPYTLLDAESYIAAAARRTPLTSFGIIVGGEAAGTISLRPGADISRFSAEVGYWLGNPFRGRGVMTEALVAITAYAFDHLSLQRVFAVPFVRNAASGRVLQKAGYLLEGRMRRSAIKESEVLDQWLYAAYAEPG